MDKDFVKQEKRIESIFPNDLEDIFKCKETIEIYKAYLENNLIFPIELTGIEDFDWEEFYLLGPGDKKEYEELKIINPSFTDIFNMTSIDNDFDIDYGLFADVIRISDNKRFLIPLAELVVIDKKSKNYQLLDDYAVWFVNY